MQRTFLIGYYQQSPHHIKKFIDHLLINKSSKNTSKIYFIFIFQLWQGLEYDAILAKNSSCDITNYREIDLKSQQGEDDKHLQTFGGSDDQLHPTKNWMKEKNYHYGSDGNKDISTAPNIRLGGTERSFLKRGDHSKVKKMAFSIDRRRSTVKVCE